MVHTAMSTSCVTAAQLEAVISVRFDDRAGHATHLDVPPGRQLTFGGCACGKCLLDLPLPVEEHFDTAGTVEARSDHWRLTNRSHTGILLCRDLEDSEQQIFVPPGRADVVIPFELAQVFSLEGGLTEVITVFGPEPALTDVRSGCPGLAEQPGFDPGTVHYGVLWALCQLALQGSVTHLTPPTTAKIARAISRYGCTLSRRSIEHHVDYLAERLHVGRRLEGSRTRSWKREAIIRRALFLGLVDPEPHWPVIARASSRNTLVEQTQRVRREAHTHCLPSLGLPSSILTRHHRDSDANSV